MGPGFVGAVLGASGPQLTKNKEAMISANILMIFLSGKKHYSTKKPHQSDHRDDQHDKPKQLRNWVRKRISCLLAAPDNQVDDDRRDDAVKRDSEKAYQKAHGAESAGISGSA